MTTTIDPPDIKSTESDTQLTETYATVTTITRRCTAKAKSSGVQCKRPPIPGGTVCRMHGGAAPQVKAAALQRLKDARDLALERLIDQMEDLGNDMDPRALADIVTKFTDKVELLEGRATKRDETNINMRWDELRTDLQIKVARLADRAGSDHALSLGTPVDRLHEDGYEIEPMEGDVIEARVVETEAHEAAHEEAVHEAYPAQAQAHSHPEDEA